MPKTSRLDERKEKTEDESEATEKIGWRTKRPFDCFPALKFRIDSEEGRFRCVYDPNLLLTILYNAIANGYAISEEEMKAEAERVGMSFEETKTIYNRMTHERVDKGFKYARKLLEQKIQLKLEIALWELGNEILARTVKDLIDTENVEGEEGFGSFAVALNELERSFSRQRKYLWDAENRGRPPKWTKGKIEQAIRRAVSRYRKKKYRSPTLEQAANEINMPATTLKKLMLRYGLRYSTYKKET
jgi:hypothetical protein